MSKGRKRRRRGTTRRPGRPTAPPASNLEQAVVAAAEAAAADPVPDPVSDPETETAMVDEADRQIGPEFDDANDANDANEPPAAVTELPPRVDAPLDEAAARAIAEAPTQQIRERPRRARPDTVTTLARRALPRGGFVKGVILALVLVLPATAGAVFLLSRLGIGGDGAAPFARVIAFAAVFAGLPAVLTAGGIGRRAAQAGAQAPARRVPRGIGAALLPFAIAGAGFVILTIVPLGALPVGALGWGLTAVAGIVAGALCGVVLGLWVASEPVGDLR